MKHAALYHHNSHASREDWHKEFAGIITALDFNTSSPNPYGIDNQFSAWRFNESGKKLCSKTESAANLDKEVD